MSKTTKAVARIAPVDLDLEKSCDIYSQSVRSTLSNLFNIDVDSDQTIKTTESFQADENIYFSILFTGQVYGEFVIGVNSRTALEMMGHKQTDGNSNYPSDEVRQELIDSFKELINIAAGATLSHLRQIYPEISITPPRAIEGRITLSKLNLMYTKLSHQSGQLSCYIYLDHMRLDIAQTLTDEISKQEELKRLNRAKTEFLANMSHELRTPLNGMIGMLDLLRGSTLNSIQKEQIGIISKSGDFLLSIINDILEFSKIESGKMELEVRPFCLRTSLESVCESLAASVFSKNLDFHVDLSPDLNGQYLGDETRIKQVLVNLIGNAVKFTPTGSISVLAEATTDASAVVIRVIDTGVGIPEQKLQAIFDSFSQADVSDNRKYGGSGLGLTISKSIVDKMNGRLSVKSAEAQGSEFIIELPLEKSQGRSAADLNSANSVSHLKMGLLTSSTSLRETLSHYLPTNHITVTDPTAEPNADVYLVDARDWDGLSPQVAKTFVDRIRAKGSYLVFLTRPQQLQSTIDLETNSELGAFYYSNLPLNYGRLINILCERPTYSKAKEVSRPTEPRPATQKLKLLLVEDNEVNRTVAKFMIAKMGFEVETANDGREALALLERSAFDLILMDCQMPNMNGYEATEAIRKNEKVSGTFTPIIAMTANAFRETKERCFECGMNDFVTKPIKMEGLKDVILRNVKKSSSH